MQFPPEFRTRPSRQKIAEQQAASWHGRAWHGMAMAAAWLVVTGFKGQGWDTGIGRILDFIQSDTFLVILPVEM